MGLARQDRGAPTQAGVASPPSRCDKELDRNPHAPQGVPGGAGPSAALTLLGDDPYHQSSRRLAANPAAPGIRPLLLYPRAAKTFRIASLNDSVDCFPVSFTAGFPSRS